MRNASADSIRYRVTAADRVLVVVAVMLLATLYWHQWNGGGPAAWVEVQVDDNEPVRYPADRDRRLTVQGAIGPSVIEIHAGAARFVDSPCNGKLCLRGGWHRHAGETGACLPNRVSLTLVGDGQAWDAINY